MSFVTSIYSRSSRSIKIGIDLSIDKSIKIGKSDLIDIDCNDQSVEIGDTLVPFIDLSRFSRFHRFLLEDTFCSYPKMKTDLIDIDCINQSVEIDDTLVPFICLS